MLTIYDTQHLQGVFKKQHTRNKVITSLSKQYDSIINNINHCKLPNQYWSCYTDNSLVSEETTFVPNYERVINLSKREMHIA